MTAFRPGRVGSDRTGTATQDTTGRRDAARMLIQQPFVAAEHDPEAFEAIRRHAGALKAMFAERLGYRLVVDATFARLVKAPLASAAPYRAARRANGDEFGATTYTCLALLCAALLVPGSPEHVQVSALVEQVRADAHEAGITLGDTMSERRHLVSALRLLQEWGVLGAGSEDLDDTDRESGDDRMSLRVNRALLPHLLARPLHTSPGPAALLSVASQDSPARRLYRRLVEDPFVSRDDLDEEMYGVLVRDRHAIAARLDEDFGLVLEVRTEGALAYDPDGALTDEPFPGSGTVKQAALLLISELTARYGPEPGAAMHVDTATLDGILTEYAAAHARTWRSAYVRDVALLRREVVSLLVRLGFVRSTDDGITVAAPAARYRPEPADSAPRKENDASAPAAGDMPASTTR